MQHRHLFFRGLSRRHFPIPQLLSLLSITACFTAPARSDQEKLPEIQGYKEWESVTEKPVTVSQQAWSLCREPTAAEAVAIGVGPHKGGAVMVRVSNTGRKQFIEERNPLFPLGTVIVKEKLLSPTDSIPESIGVMVKVSSGWEFGFINSAGKAFRGRAQLPNCYDCHAKAQEWDGVFRTYLTNVSKLANIPLPR